MKILLVYLPFCTPVSPPYSLTNLHAFLSHNSKQEIKVLDLNIKFHQLKFKDAQQYFQLDKWGDYEKEASKYHKLSAKVYSENNSLIVKGEEPEYFDELLQEIKNEKPDIVAFSLVYSSQAFYAHTLLKKLNVTTVIGGPCVNKKLISLSDHHFQNELEFLNFIEKKKHSELVFDFPLDFSIYNLNEYFTPQTVIPIKTSTTCYYQQCTFCAHYAKVPYKEYPLNNIETTIVKSGKKHFFLIDDMIPLKRLLELGKIFRKYDAKWGCQLRPTKEFSSEALKTLSSSGLHFVLWGVESGCQKTLDAIKKGTNVTDIKEVLKNSHNAGIKNVVYTLFGFPGESKEDFIETVNFLEKNSNYIDLISVSTFGLHKGTKIFDNPQQFGITKINEEARTVLDPKITYSVKGLSLEEVKKLKKKYSKVINKVNKFPKTINFFREHMFFID